MRTPLVLALLVALPLGGSVFAETEEAVTLRWRLSRSDYVRYDHRQVTKTEDGKEERSDPVLWTVHGHDIRAESQYQPGYPTRADLAAILALQLPLPQLKEGRVNRDLKLLGIAPLRITGTITGKVRKDEENLIDLVGDYRFTTRGSPEQADTHRWS